MTIVKKCQVYKRINKTPYDLLSLSLIVSPSSGLIHPAGFITYRVPDIHNEQNDIGHLQHSP